MRTSMRTMRRRLPTFIIAILFLVLALSGCRSAPTGPEDVTVVTDDGFRLAATAWGSGHLGVVLAHDPASSREAMLPVAEFLVAKGFNVVLFTWRGFPGSDGLRDPATMPRDVVGAGKFLRSRGATSVAYLGAGAGGTLAIKAAVSAPNDVQALVLASVPLKFETIDVTDGLLQLFTPKMVVVAVDDPAAWPAAQEIMKRAPDPKTLDSVNGGLHGEALLAGPSEGDLRDRLAKYLESTLGGK